MAIKTYSIAPSSIEKFEVIIRQMDYSDWQTITSYPCMRGSKITVLDYQAAGNHVVFIINSDTDHTTATGYILNAIAPVTLYTTVSTNTDGAITPNGVKTYVDSAFSNLVNSSPSSLDTLNELAAALGNDANFATTVTNSLATKWTIGGNATTTQAKIGSTTNFGINLITNNIPRLSINNTGDIFNTATAYASLDITNAATSRGTIVISGANTTINNSNLVVSSTIGVQVGDSISASGIPTNTFVTHILNSTTICMSALATATATVTVTVTKQTIAQRFASTANTTRGLIIENQTRTNNPAITIFNGGLGGVPQTGIINIIDNNGASSAATPTNILSVTAAYGLFNTGAAVMSNLLNMTVNGQGTISFSTPNGAFQIANTSSTVTRLQNPNATATILMGNNIIIGGYGFANMTDLLSVGAPATFVNSGNIFNISSLQINNTAAAITVRGFYANNNIINLASGSTLSIIDINPVILASSGSIDGIKCNISYGNGRYNLNITGTANNYLAGNTSIGTTTNTASLTIGASTTSKASLRVLAGTTPTTPNDGDIWYDGTNIYLRVGSTTKIFTTV